MIMGDNSSCKVICPCLCFPSLPQICQGLCATLVNVTQLSEFPFISSNFLPFPTTGQFTIQHLGVGQQAAPLCKATDAALPSQTLSTKCQSHWRKTNVLPYP